MKLDDCLDEIAHQRSVDTYYKISVIKNKSSKKKGGYKHFYAKVRIMKTPLASIEVTVPLGTNIEVWDKYKTLDPVVLYELIRDDVEHQTKNIIMKMLTIR
jgi:hypothetical protein